MIKETEMTLDEARSMKKKMLIDLNIKLGTVETRLEHYKRMIKILKKQKTELKSAIKEWETIK